jgi:hypothetical protein
MNHISLFGLFFFLASCSTNESSFNSKFEFDSDASSEATVVEHVSSDGVEQTKDGTVEWISCRSVASHSWFLLLNPEDSVFSKKETCQSRLAGVFLTQGYSILALNRPGSGKSMGADKFGDDVSLRALKGAVLAISKNQDLKIAGLWSYGDASFLGLRVAKELPLDLMIIGDAPADMERLFKESKDQGWVSKLKEVQNDEGDLFLERRSISWDFSALPKTVYIYHAAGNMRVPLQHSIDFKNSLATAGFSTDLLVFQATNSSDAKQPLPHDKIIKSLLQKYLPQGKQTP